MRGHNRAPDASASAGRPSGFQEDFGPGRFGGNDVCLARGRSFSACCERPEPRALALFGVRSLAGRRDPFGGCTNRFDAVSLRGHLDEWHADDSIFGWDCRRRAVRLQDLNPFGGSGSADRRAHPTSGGPSGSCGWSRGAAFRGGDAASRHRAPSGDTDRRWMTPRGLLLALERPFGARDSAAEVRPSGRTRANVADPVPPSPGERAVRCGAAFGL